MEKLYISIPYGHKFPAFLNGDPEVRFCMKPQRLYSQSSHRDYNHYQKVYAEDS